MGKCFFSLATAANIGTMTTDLGAIVVDPNADSVARALLLDCRAADAIKYLRAAGVTSILLKGASIATWLYGNGDVRPYVDIDLLVSPLQLQTATTILAELGYAPRLSGADPSELGTKELDLIGPDDVCIDLHYGLIGASRPSELCWDIVAGRTVEMHLGAGTAVPVLDPPTRAMHLALHAAQNGPVDFKAVSDLGRGLSRVARDDWAEAARVADELGAAEAFAAGLRLLPAGRTLADELRLTHQMSVELRLRTWSAPQQAIFFERLGEVPGVRRKIVLLARKMFPTSATICANSAIASRGQLGLAYARVAHPVSVVAHFPPALIAWHRAQRATRSP